MSDPRPPQRFTWKRLLCLIGIHDTKETLYYCKRCPARWRKSMIMAPGAPLYDKPHKSSFSKSARRSSAPTRARTPECS